ncbi:MAG: hypothetical protein E7030_01365 [Akkermansiaceae bacterium]|nr:hypothetical protein [Akkermansiaceae bacterium]
MYDGNTCITTESITEYTRDAEEHVTIATRPLAIQKDGTWYTYGLDLTKNVCEVFGSSGYIGTAYTYSPFGEVTATGNVEQPIQWSSEFNDSELGTPHFYIAYNSGTEYVYMNTYALEMIKGKLYNIYTRSDLTQTILADTSDGISKASHGIRSNELPFRKIHYLGISKNSTKTIYLASYGSPAPLQIGSCGGRVSKR